MNILDILNIGLITDWDTETAEDPAERTGWLTERFILVGHDPSRSDIIWGLTGFQPATEGTTRNPIRGQGSSPVAFAPTPTTERTGTMKMPEEEWRRIETFSLALNKNFQDVTRILLRICHPAGQAAYGYKYTIRFNSFSEAEHTPDTEEVIYDVEFTQLGARQSLTDVSVYIPLL